MPSTQYIDREMKLLPAKPGSAEFLRGYLNTKYDLLGLPVPVQRARFKQGFSRLSGLSPQQQAQFWLLVWNESSLMESMSQVILFFEAWANDRKQLAKNGQIKLSTVYGPIWPYLVKMVRRIDNWAHSDGISSLISAAVEENPRQRFATLAKWNRDKHPWLRRQSIVSLHYYARQRKRPLPPSKTLPLIRRLIRDEDFYVQRGVGWALRECLSVNRMTAQRFLDQHIGELSAIAFSAATEKLDSKTKLQLKAKRARHRTAHGVTGHQST